MKRVLIVGAILAVAALAFAQVPGASQFHLPGEDPWWRPFNPQGQSYGISVGTTRPVRTLGSPDSAPRNGELFLDMDGAADSGPVLEVYDGVNSEWDSLGSSGIISGLTADTLIKVNSAGTALADSVLTDDGTDLTLATGGEFRLHDGSTADDAIVFGATQDYAIYWSDANSSLHIDSVAAAGNVRIIGDSATRGANILTLHSQGDPSTFIHGFSDLTAAANGGNIWNLGLGGTIGAMTGSATTRAFRINLVNGAHTGTGNTYNIIDIEPFTGDANSNTNAILIGALTGTTGAAGEVEVAIAIGAGWDYGLSILDDGSATLSAITLGDSRTADAQIYWSGSNLVLDVDGASSNGIEFMIGATGAESVVMRESTGTNLLTWTGINATGTAGSIFDISIGTILELSTDIVNMVSLDLNDSEFDTAGGSTFNYVLLEGFTPDANVDYNGLLIEAITGDSGTETAINIATGWDYGLSILGDGSAITNNITLGLSQTADFQMYFDNAGVVFDLDGTAGNTADFQIDGDAAASRSLLSLTGTFGALDGSDTQRGLYLNLTNANHSGSANVITALEIAAITGDAQATETGLIVGAGFDLAARFDAPVEKNAYRQDFDGPCTRRDNVDFTAEGVGNADVNIALCEGDIGMFVYRLDGAQATPFVIAGNGLDIDQDGIDNEGVEIILSDNFGAPATGWAVVGTSPALFFRASVTIASVSGTDNMFIGWRQVEGFVDDLVIATYDTYGVHLINDTSGNLQIQTGDDTADGTDENDQVAAFGDGETHIFEVRVATSGDFSFFIDGLPVTESNATGAAAAGEILYPFIGMLNAASADTEMTIHWIEIGEVI